MLIKLFGIILILCSSSLIGFRLSRELEERILELSEIKKMIIMLRGEIKYGNSVLSEAFLSIGGRMKEPYGAFLLESQESMEQKKGQTFQEIWKEQVEKHLKKTTLSEKDLLRLNQFGEQLGYLDKDMQLSTIELYLEQLEEEINGARENSKKNGRLYQSLGIMGGVLITVLIF